MPYVATMDDHVAGLNDRFYKDKTFGGIMTASTHFLRRELREIVEDSLSNLDKAKTLYAYVRDNFTTKGSEMLSDEDRTSSPIPPF